ISQADLHRRGLGVAPPRGLHQLRREDGGADPRVRLQRARRRAVLGCLPGGDRVVLLHATRALARAASALGIGRGTAAPVGTPWMWTLAFWHHEGRTPDSRLRSDARGCDGGEQSARRRASQENGGRTVCYHFATQLGSTGWNRENQP